VSVSAIDVQLLRKDRGHGVLRWQLLVHGEVVRLEVEQAGANMPTHILLVAVVAEALAVTLLHLRRRETTKLPPWSRRSRTCWCHGDRSQGRSTGRDHGRPGLSGKRGRPWRETCSVHLLGLE